MKEKNYLGGLKLIERKKIFQGLQRRKYLRKYLNISGAIGRKYLRGWRLTEGKKIFKELKINGRGRKYLRGKKIKEELNT